MHLQGLQLQKFIHEIRTSGGHNVRFRHSAPLSKTFAQMCTALTLLDKLEVQKLALNASLSEVVPRDLDLACPKCFKTSARNSVQHKKSRP